MFPQQKDLLRLSKYHRPEPVDYDTDEILQLITSKQPILFLNAQNTHKERITLNDKTFLQGITILFINIMKGTNDGKTI